MDPLDQQIAQIRGQLATKTADLNTALNKDRPDIAAGKAAQKEIEALRKSLGEAEQEKADADQLRGFAKSATAFINAPGGPPPTSSGPGFTAVKGWEAAGQTTFARDSHGMSRMIAEAGPGAFKGKTWETLQQVEYKADFFRYLRTGVESKTFQEARDDQGGMFAPADILQTIIGRKPAPTLLQGLVNSITTGRDSVEMPRVQYSADDKYTTAFRPTWTGETPSDGTGDMHAINDNDVFGTITIPIHTAMLSGSLSKNLIEDSAFPIQSWLEAKLGEAVELLREEMIVSGDGNGKPHGILFGAASGNNGSHVQYPEVILSGAAGALSNDLLDDMQTALAVQYENENTRWVMNKKSTLRAIRKLKDSQNRPLFTLGSQDYGIAGARGRVLLGDPIAVSGFMPDVGANNFPIIYGDLSGYMLPQRIGFSIQVLTETRVSTRPPS